MHSTHLLLEEPIRMSSILEPSKPSFFPAMTKIVGTLGPKSRSAEVISACLKVGMSVARFDFSWGDVDYHQETLENLKTAVKSTKKLCAVMLDTVGPELQVVNKSGNAISLEADAAVVLTPDHDQEASSEVLPINFTGLAKGAFGAAANLRRGKKTEEFLVWETAAWLGTGLKTENSFSRELSSLSRVRASRRVYKIAVLAESAPNAPLVYFNIYD